MKKLTNYIITLAIGLVFIYTCMSIIISTIQGYNIIHNGTLSQIYSFFHNEPWYVIGRLPFDPHYKDFWIIVIPVGITFLLATHLDNVGYYGLRLFIPVAVALTLSNVCFSIWGLPSDHIPTAYPSRVEKLANTELLKHYTTDKTITSDHFSRIDDTTFVVNNKTYKIKNKNNIKTNYNKTGQNRNIKITYKIVDKKLPKAAETYRTIPLYKSAHNNPTTKVEINQ